MQVYESSEQITDQRDAYTFLTVSNYGSCLAVFTFYHAPVGVLALERSKPIQSDQTYLILYTVVLLLYETPYSIQLFTTKNSLFKRANNIKIGPTKREKTRHRRHNQMQTSCVEGWPLFPSHGGHFVTFFCSRHVHFNSMN